jgi:hypothetical protein
MTALQARCIGTEDEQHGPLEFISGAPPCGWQGPVSSDWALIFDHRPPVSVLAVVGHCPWCHTGRVELIAEDHTARGAS